MSNEPNTAPNAPASDAGDPLVKTSNDVKPAEAVGPAAPVATPTETKKS